MVETALFMRSKENKKSHCKSKNSNGDSENKKRKQQGNI